MQEKLQVSFTSPSSENDIVVTLRRGKKEIVVGRNDLSLISQIYEILSVNIEPEPTEEAADGHSGS